MRTHANPSNNSPTKQKYSFSKEERFKTTKPQSDVYYLPTEDRDRRSALIGYGQRSLGVMHPQKAYGSVPHAYDIPSTLEKRGHAFKGGRYQIGSYLENLKYLQSVPGPNYETPSTLDKIGVLLTSKPPDFSLKSAIAVPGPGTYSVPSTLKVSNQKDITDSKYENPGSIKIFKSLDISRRKEPVVFNPGPGQYDVIKYGIGNPENPYGKNQNTKFSKSVRNPLSTKGAENSPSPAQYKIYSQFE